MKLRGIYSLFFVFLMLFIGYSNDLQAQTTRNEILKGKTISASIKQGEKQKYTIKLNEKQFAFLKLIQKGVDVTISASDPDGKKLDEFDSPNGKEGPEPITLISHKKGTYLLEVYPTDKEETGGTYTIEMIRTEPLATTPEKQIDQLLIAWDNPQTPGAAIAVVRNGRIIFKKGYGSANLEYDIPVSPSTVFHIASVSKQFTAFSVLLLAREGKLSLDDDIRKYIPEIPDFGRVITLRQLAHHTSGLRDQWNLLAMAGWRLDDVITKEHILKLISKQQELNFNPNDEFLYCNTGFTLLAEVVARVSGKSFADFTKERIFDPLRMNNTLFYDDHEKIVRNRAYSFYEAVGGYKKSVLSYANVGATSLFTTVEDLSLWAMNFENPVVGDAEIIKEMNRKGILNNGDTISYALGQDVDKYKGLKFISHGGGDAGYRTFLGRFPDQKFSVIVFSNLASFNPFGIGLKIAEIYLKNSLTEPPPKETSATPPPDKPFVADAEVFNLKEFAGDFHSPELSTTYTFIPQDGKLLVRHPRLNDIVLTPSKKDLFSGNEWFFSQVEFIRDSWSDVIGCRVSNGRVRNLWFQKQ